MSKIATLTDANGNIRYIYVNSAEEEKVMYKRLANGCFVQEASQSLALGRAIDKAIKNPPRVSHPSSGYVSHKVFNERLNRMRESLKRRGIY